MPVNYVQLATELNTDPVGYGYATLIAIGNDSGLADMLNKVRSGNDGFPALTIRRSDCKPSEILEAIDIRDLLASPPGVSNNTFASGWFESVTQFPTIRLTNADGTKTVVRRNIDRMVGDTQGSQTRLDAVAIRNGSRAEFLFGQNTRVTSDDIAKALRPNG